MFDAGGEAGSVEPRDLKQMLQRRMVFDLGVGKSIDCASEHLKSVMRRTVRTWFRQQNIFPIVGHQPLGKANEAISKNPYD
jgi:hypothetical protein